MRVKMMVLVLCVLSVTPVAEAARVALVIGNAAYPPKKANVNRFGPLSNASVNDARDMAAALQNYGFQVTPLINADRAQMEQAVNAFAEKLGPSSVGLFYYAGHGIQVRGENYLLPVGRSFFDEADITDKDGAYKANLALKKMEFADAQVKIMILDACRNDFEELRGDEPRGLAEMTASGVIVSYAASPGRPANANPGEHGVYTRHLPILSGAATW